MIELRWKLSDYLIQRNLSAQRLIKAAPCAHAGTVHRLAQKGEEPTQVDLPTLEAIIEGLRLLTHEPVVLSDLLETIERTSYADLVLRDAKPLDWDRLVARTTPKPSEDPVAF